MFLYTGKKYTIIAGKIIRMNNYNKNGRVGVTIILKDYKQTEYSIFFTNYENKDFVKRFQKSTIKVDDIICCCCYTPSKDQDATKLAGIDFEAMFQNGFRAGRLFTLSSESDNEVNVYFGKVANPRDGMLKQFYISGKVSKKEEQKDTEEWISFSFWDDNRESSSPSKNATNARKVLQKGDIVCILGGKILEKEYQGKITKTISTYRFAKLS